MLKRILPIAAALVFAAWQSIATAQDQQPTTLPWEASRRVSTPILRPPAGPQEILERYELGVSQLAGFVNGQPFSPAEEDLLVKILYRLPRIGMDHIERWRQQGVTWDQLAAAAADYRVQVFHARGRVRRVEKRTLPSEQAELYEFAQYYRVTLALADSPYEAIVFARHLPATWQLDALLDEPAVVDGLFLKLGDAAVSPRQFYFATSRVAWLPEQVHPEQGIGPSHVALAKAGMDAGLWDDVRNSNGAPLGDADREAFYQLLTAVTRPAAGELRTSWDKPLDLVPLLERPIDLQSSILPVEGRTQRIMKVPVADIDIQNRFGLDHYYEIDMLLPLGATNLRFGNDAAGGKRPEFRNHFPATLIVRDLPAGLAEGESVRQTILADAVFFKIWTYRANYTEQFAQLQPAPLFVAREPRIVPSGAGNWDAGLFIVTALGLTVGVIVLVIWWSSRDNTAARQQTAQRKQAQPDFSKFAD